MVGAVDTNEARMLVPPRTNGADVRVGPEVLVGAACVLVAAGWEVFVGGACVAVGFTTALVAVTWAGAACVAVATRAGLVAVAASGEKIAVRVRSGVGKVKGVGAVPAGRLHAARKSKTVTAVRDRIVFDFIS